MRVGSPLRRKNELRDCPIRQQKGVGRRRRCMRIHHYPSDVTDEQWALIEPQLPPAPPGGRPRKTAMRDVVDAIFYILRTGCQWRYLPADLPPRSTVWRISIGGVATAPWTPSMTCSAARSAPREALPPPHLRECRQPVG